MRLWKVYGALHGPKGIIMAFVSVEGSLGNINLLHINLVISRMKIKFGKKLGIGQFIQNIISDWNGKFILDGNFVESTKIMAHVPSAFFF
jgi:hypothetical protein